MHVVMLWLHVVTSIGALVAGVGIPLQLTVERQSPDSDIVGVAGRTNRVVRLYAICLAVAGVLGFGLVSTGDDVSWSAPWLWLGIIGWVAANGMLHGAFAPAMRALSAGDEAAEHRARLLGASTAAIVAVVFAVMLVQPG